MSELFKIILTSSLTIFGGILIYVVGRIIEKFFIEPIHEQFKIIGKIADSLIFYANIYTNPGSKLIEKEKMDEASNVLRQQASHLMAKTQVIQWYKFWQHLRIMPKYADVIEAHGKLITLSNSVHKGKAIENDSLRKEIEKLLRIKLT
jgi:hypothetical protein